MAGTKKSASKEPLQSPQGFGIALWANLSKGGALAKAARANPTAALPLAQEAIKFRNPAVRRNAIRVLRAVGEAQKAAQRGPVLESLAVAAGGGRPHVMFEALAASRALQGLPEEDLDARYPGIPAVGDKDQGPLRDSALGIRWRHETWRTFAPKPADDKYRPTDHPEEASESHRALWGPPHSISGVAGPVLPDVWMAQAPRGEVLEAIKEALEGDRPNRIWPALRRLWFLEDPLARPWVRRLASHDDNKVRRHTLQTLGYIGDEASLPLLAEKVRAGGHDAHHALSGLSLLGDYRVFEECWKVTEGAKLPEPTVEVFRMLDEVNTAIAFRLAQNPAVFAKPRTREIFQKMRDPEGTRFVIDAVGAATDEAVVKALLGPYMLTPEKVEERRRWNRLLSGGRITYEGSNSDWYSNLAAPADVEEEEYGEPMAWWRLHQALEGGDRIWLGDFEPAWCEALRREARRIVADTDATQARKASARRTLEAIEGGAGVAPDKVPQPVDLKASPANAGQGGR